MSLALGDNFYALYSPEQGMAVLDEMMYAVIATSMRLHMVEVLSKSAIELVQEIDDWEWLDGFIGNLERDMGQEKFFNRTWAVYLRMAMALIEKTRAEKRP